MHNVVVCFDGIGLCFDASTSVVGQFLIFLLARYKRINVLLHLGRFETRLRWSLPWQTTPSLLPPKFVHSELVKSLLFKLNALKWSGACGCSGGPRGTLTCPGRTELWGGQICLRGAPGMRDYPWAIGPLPNRWGSGLDMTDFVGMSRA